MHLATIERVLLAYAKACGERAGAEFATAVLAGECDDQLEQDHALLDDNRRAYVFALAGDGNRASFGDVDPDAHERVHNVISAWDRLHTVSDFQECLVDALDNAIHLAWDTAWLASMRSVAGESGFRCPECSSSLPRHIEAPSAGESATVDVCGACGSQYEIKG